jgi:phage shock protein A
MASLGEKLRMGLLAELHELVDRAIDYNSPQVLRQYIREVEGRMEELDNVVAEYAGGLKTLRREFEETADRVQELDSNIDELLSDGDTTNDHLAVRWQMRLDALTKRQEALSNDVTIREQALTALENTRTSMEARKNSMIAQLDSLDALERAKDAREHAASTIEMANRISGTVEEVSVDNVVRNMRRDADIAEERLNRAMAQASNNNVEDEATEMAKIRLQKRRERLSARTTEQTDQTLSENQSRLQSE